jgi:hypothetical protein
MRCGRWPCLGPVHAAARAGAFTRFLSCFFFTHLTKLHHLQGPEPFGTHCSGTMHPRPSARHSVDPSAFTASATSCASTRTHMPDASQQQPMHPTSRCHVAPQWGWVATKQACLCHSQRAIKVWLNALEASTSGVCRRAFIRTGDEAVTTICTRHIAARLAAVIRGHVCAETCTHKNT